MKVVTVLRTGGEFGVEHVQAMQRQVDKWAPKGTEFLCLSDVPVPGVETRELWHDWPGWWCKLEMFRSTLGGGDFLYTDLDNVILGPIGDLFNVGGKFTMQRGGWTALMYVTEQCLGLYTDFVERPAENMAAFNQKNVEPLNGMGNYGDAGFVSFRLGRKAQHWEDILPTQVTNISQLWLNTGLGRRLAPVPPNTRILLCGQPLRPWRVPMFERQYWCKD